MTRTTLIKLVLIAIIIILTASTTYLLVNSELYVNTMNQQVITSFLAFSPEFIALFSGLIIFVASMVVVFISESTNAPN